MTLNKQYKMRVFTSENQIITIFLPFKFNKKKLEEKNKKIKKNTIVVQNYIHKIFL